MTLAIENPFGPPSETETFVSENKNAISNYLSVTRADDRIITFDSIRADFPSLNLSDGRLAAIFEELGIPIFSKD